jgi:hypothetical protein
MIDCFLGFLRALSRAENTLWFICSFSGFSACLYEPTRKPLEEFG